MPHQVTVNNEPRKPWTLRTFFSFVGEAANITAYVVSLFHKGPATFISFGGFAIARVADAFRKKEHIDKIDELNRDADARERERRDRITVTVTPAFTQLRDEIGLKEDYCTTTAGKCSSTVLIISSLLQTTATTCNGLVLYSDLNKESKIALSWTAAVAGGLAIALPRVLRHYEDENQERAKIKAHKRLFATQGIPVDNETGPIGDPWSPPKPAP